MQENEYEYEDSFARSIIKMEKRTIDIGDICPVCRSGEIVEIPSGMKACESCNYSD